MKISTTLAFDGDPARYARRAKDLESAGVDLVWSGEIYGFDLVSSKPKMLVNLTQARKQLISFRADILKLMVVYE